jgi:hypothetical protein
MTKRRVIIGAVVVVLLFAAGLGISALTRGGQPTTTTAVAESTSSSAPTTPATKAPTTDPTTVSTPPTEEPTTANSSELPSLPPSGGLLPAPAFGSLASAETVQLFDRLTILKPHIWTDQSGDSDSQDYADTTVCAASQESDCPRISFLGLKAGPNKVNYGSNPIAAWAKDVCPDRRDAVEGPAAFQSSGVNAGFYRLRCQGMEYYAWYVPAQHLIVLGRDGSDGSTLETGIVQAVLQRIVWN